MIDNGGKEP